MTKQTRVRQRVKNVKEEMKTGACGVEDLHWGNNFTQDEQGGLTENVTSERADSGEGVSYLAGRRTFQAEGTARAKAQGSNITDQKEIRMSGMI